MEDVTALQPAATLAERDLLQAYGALARLDVRDQGEEPLHCLQVEPLRRWRQRLSDLAEDEAREDGGEDHEDTQKDQRVRNGHPRTRLRKPRAVKLLQVTILGAAGGKHAPEYAGDG
eukprot:CAMPEP_0176040334 /NCGR_PEP_ID=MMETSP0120_2-20121206/19999_1 /TAXON_ID=160619 /ORGANISM="Kryptoperidinium foliaceum, Strain CCMP 1326" /LENGTH=116 /DNA_ID=CAMNT_0017373731 /DNA_START=274 /DNA_END=621 /DNA_ORIENTATION=+